MAVRFQESVRAGDRAAKAGCYHCLKNTGGLLDLDMVIEGEGRLFICAHLGAEIAKVLGFTSSKQAKDNAELIKENALIVKGLQEALRDKEQLISEQAVYIEKHLTKPKTAE